MLVADLPETREIRVIRHAFEDQRGRPIRQRAVHNIAVTGDPADIGGTPVNVAIVIIEHVLMGHRRVDHVAAGRVQHALRGAGRAGCIENEQRIFGVHFLRRAFGRGLGHGFVVPDIAPVDPADIVAGALHNDAFFDRRALGERFIDIGLERDRLAAAQSFI